MKRFFLFVCFGFLGGDGLFLIMESLSKGMAGDPTSRCHHSRSHRSWGVIISKGSSHASPLS